jgi:RND family efflux transporter MFP subunit
METGKFMEMAEATDKQDFQQSDPAGMNTSAHSQGAQDHQPKRPGKSLIWIVFAVIIVLGIGIFFGIHSRASADTELAKVADASSVPTVHVTHPVVGEQLQKVDLPGNVQAFNDTPIYSRTSGYLKKWYVDIGTHVKQGELMAEIETPEMDQQLMQAQGDLKTAQANLDIAAITSKRWQNLLAKHAVSKQETDQAMSDLSARQSAVSASEANVRRLQELQSFERVVAPFDGVVTARNVDIGSLIEAGANSGPKELFHLAALNRLRVYIAVPEAYSSAVTNGAKVTLTEVDHPAETFTGVLTRNSNAFDPMSRTLTAEADVNNAKGLLLPGAYVFVHFQLAGNLRSVTLPSNALLFRSEGLRVAVVRDGKVILTPVTIGHDYGNTVEITAGLTTGDAVVINPPDSISSGEAVHVAADQTGSNAGGTNEGKANGGQAGKHGAA